MLQISRTLSNHNPTVITLFYYPDWVGKKSRLEIPILKKNK